MAIGAKDKERIERLTRGRVFEIWCAGTNMFIVPTVGNLRWWDQTLWG